MVTVLPSVPVTSALASYAAYAEGFGVSTANGFPNTPTSTNNPGGIVDNGFNNPNNYATLPNGTIIYPTPHRRLRRAQSYHGDGGHGEHQQPVQSGHDHSGLWYAVLQWRPAVVHGL